MKIKFFAWALSLLLLMSVNAYADYYKPLNFEGVYDFTGSFDLNITLTDAMKNKIVSEWPKSGMTTDKIFSYADIANGSWEMTPLDYQSLALWGAYGVVDFPLTNSGTGDNVYVLQCTFSDDVKAGEPIECFGFPVDVSTRRVNTDVKSADCDAVFLDENLNRVYNVPESKKIYAAVSFSPSEINTGVLAVMRGEYVAEEDPTDRLDPEFAQNIADDLGINVDELKYYKHLHIGKPVEPTEAMKEYVRRDNYEIFANLPTISADEEGWYAVKITLSDDIWEEVKDKNVSDYKLYGLNDSDLGDGQFQPAFITGVINMWELFTLKGEKLTKFGVKEFLMVGFLNAGKPFSFYLAKLILALLMGGCETFSGLAIIPLAFLFIKFIKKQQK